MNYFRFFPDCHYISGPVRGAIYHLGENRIIHLPPPETTIINAWLGNKTISETKAEYGEKAVELLDSLIREGIGTTFSTPVFTETFEPSFVYKQNKLYERPPEMKFAYLRLDSKCNAACGFCGNPDYLTVNGCHSCLKWPACSAGNGLESAENRDSGYRLKPDDYQAIIKHLADLETECLTFTGGNPLLQWDTVASLIETAVKFRPSFRNIIQTNGFGFNSALAHDAGWLDVEFLFTVFSNSKEGYRRITGSGELFDSLLKAIDLCKENQIPYQINLLVCPDSWPDFNDILQFARTLGGSFIYFSEVFNDYEGKKPLASLPLGEEWGEQFFQSIYPGDFFAAKYYNRCLFGKVAISEQGQILPCPMWDKPVGQMPESDIITVLRELTLQNQWKKNKDTVLVCRQCEFRFVCNDCALTEQYRTRYPAIHDIICTYRPEHGKWRDSIAAK